MARDMKAGARKGRRGRPSQAPAAPTPQAAEDVLGPQAHIGPFLQWHLLKQGL